MQAREVGRFNNPRGGSNVADREWGPGHVDVSRNAHGQSNFCATPIWWDP